MSIHYPLIKFTLARGDNVDLLGGEGEGLEDEGANFTREGHILSKFYNMAL